MNLRVHWENNGESFWRKIEGLDRNEWIATNALYVAEFEAEASEIGLAYASNVEW